MSTSTLVGHVNTTPEQFPVGQMERWKVLSHSLRGDVAWQARRHLSRQTLSDRSTAFRLRVLTVDGRPKVVQR